MVKNYIHAGLFKEDSIDKQLVIDYGNPDDVITNTDIYQQQMTLKEVLCSSDNLQFGTCTASTLNLQVTNRFSSFIGKTLTVKMYLNHDMDNPFQIGIYKVAEDKPDGDRYYRKLTCYDALYDIINADVTSWYQTTFPEEDTVITLKEMRDSFFDYLGIEQNEIILINDGMPVAKTIDPQSISGKDIITAICEINGVFGHIDRFGKFKYVKLEGFIDSLYPREDIYPADDLYPRSGNTERITKTYYTSAKYDDYLVKKITKLQIRQEENDIGAIVGDGDNCYIIEDNFLVYGKDAAELNDIAQNLLNAIKGICNYRPFECHCKGNPCIEIGDAVRLSTRNEIIEGYVLERTLKGIQALTDVFKCKSDEIYTEDMNSVNTSIIQLKGKVNLLTRTVDHSISELYDLEKGLDSKITQTAGQLTVEINRAKASEADMSAKITANATQILSKVSKGSISSEISQESDKIRISANRFILDSTNLKIDEDGTIHAINGEFSGTIKSKNAEITGGYINIQTSKETDDCIELNKDEYRVRISPERIMVSKSDFQYSFIDANTIILRSGDNNSSFQLVLNSSYGIISHHGLNLYANGRITLNAPTVMYNGLQVYGNSTLVDTEVRSLSVTQGLNVAWDSTFRSGLKVNGSTTLGSTTCSSLNATSLSSGSANITGTLTCNSISVTSKTILSNIYFANNLASLTSQVNGLINQLKSCPLFM